MTFNDDKTTSTDSNQILLSDKDRAVSTYSCRRWSLLSSGLSRRRLHS